MFTRFAEWLSERKLKQKARARTHNARLQIEQGAAVLDCIFASPHGRLDTSWHRKILFGAIITRRFEWQGILATLFPDMEHEECLSFLTRIDPKVGGGTMHGFHPRNLEGDLLSEDPLPEDIDLAWAIFILDRHKKDTLARLRRAA